MRCAVGLVFLWNGGIERTRFGLGALGVGNNSGGGEVRSDGGDDRW